MTAAEPIVLTIDLEMPPAHAYAAFVDCFDVWWPVVTHSLSRGRETSCRIEPHPGGAVEEHAPDGTLHAWGEVLALEPGRHIRFSWHPGRTPESAQWVDVEFAPIHGGSRVTLSHGGWEALGELGPLLRQEYLPGWRHVFQERYAAFARRQS